MFIYADVLIILNFLVDYFLLLATGKLIRIHIKTFRILLAALFGGISSLYIFLPKSTLIAEIYFKTLICFISCLIGFGFGTVKRYLKSSAVYFVITCSYAGVMMAVFKFFKPFGMLVNNSVVYFNISPIILIGTTVLIYIIFLSFSKIFALEGEYAQRCSVSVFLEENSTQFDAIIDTGNSLEDMFGKSEIIIVDNNVIEKLLNLNRESYLNRYRAIPLKTVSGEDILSGYRCDRAVIEYNGKRFLLKSPILAISKSEIKDGYAAIINPKAVI